MASWGILFGFVLLLWHCVCNLYHPNGVLWFTLLAINAALKMGLLVDDIGKLEMLSSRGYKHSGEILDGCVIALDGFGVAT